MSVPLPWLPTRSPGAVLLPIWLIADIQAPSSSRKAAPLRRHDDIFDSTRRCHSPTSSSCASMDSNREKLTPEADSSPDGSPMPASTNFAKLKIKSNSPSSPEPHIQRSTSSLKRPATDEPLDRGCNGSESPGRDAVHRNSNQRSPLYPNCPPHHKYQKQESCKDRESQDSCAEMKLYPDCRRPSPKITIADRQDSGVVLEVR